ncbi:hypothetical protein MJO29_006042 [Puccinia striiformis f. sp. tritici]|nr:hypothetical protein MJO29_006042 [Puccinia striiformis f. sp. tritici]
MSKSNPKDIPEHLRLEHQKILQIWNVMKSINLTPELFILAFLKNEHIEVNIRRAMWGAPDGWNSTQTVLDHIRGVVCNNGIEGIDNWRNYILEEAKGRTIVFQPRVKSRTRSTPHDNRLAILISATQIKTRPKC